VLGQYEAVGVRPRFMEALAARGISLPSDLFAVGRVSA
jgi:pilus assembly protein CpaF